jgi:hypothetical protein
MGSLFLFLKGRNDHGQLGHGDTVSRTAPRVIERFKRVKIKVRSPYQTPAKEKNEADCLISFLLICSMFLVVEIALLPLMMKGNSISGEWISNICQNCIHSLPKIE